MYTQSHLHNHGALIAGILLVFAAGMFAPSANAQVGLGLSPMRLEYGVPAGGQQSGVLTLINDSSGPVRVRTELLDFLIDETQTPQFEPSLTSEAGLTCRDWLSANPMETELGPQKQISVRYTIRVPEAAASPRSYHCAIGFSTLPTEGQLGGTGIKTAIRVVSAFYVIVGKPGIEGGFKDLKLVKRGDPNRPTWYAEVVMENFSYMHFRPVGDLSVIDAEGNVIETAAFTPMPVLPKREQRLLIAFKHDFAPATYTLRARVDIGTKQIEEGTAVVSVGGTK